MKKIGILSMQRIKNYGSFLQAYALKTIIESMGYSVEFVDYHVEKSVVDSDSKKNKKIAKILRIIKGKAKLQHKIQYILHKKNFDENFKILKLTKKANYNPKLDTLVIGSDEVFNIIQANKNVGYSLELLGKNNNAKKVITYAASFGNTTIEKIDKYGKREELSNLLKKMDMISVRDDNSLNIVKELTNQIPEINLDPVLIFDYMNSNLIPANKEKEKYMILYAYNGRIIDEEARYIKKYAKQRKVKVYCIGGAQPYADKFIDCSPFEVLAYFKNAEYIVTDTFHGSIFSIINNKPFATLVRKSYDDLYGNEEKITSLLNKLNLIDRIAYSIEEIKNILEKNIDYQMTNSILEQERKKTIDYLQKNI